MPKETCHNESAAAKNICIAAYAYEQHETIKGINVFFWGPLKTEEKNGLVRSYI